MDQKPGADVGPLPEPYEWYQEQIAGHHPSITKNGEYQIGQPLKSLLMLMATFSQDCDAASWLNSSSPPAVSDCHNGSERKAEYQKVIKLKFWKEIMISSKLV